MVVTRANFAVSLLLSLAAIATADYYVPSTPPPSHLPGSPLLPPSPPSPFSPETKPTVPSPPVTPMLPHPDTPILPSPETKPPYTPILPHPYPPIIPPPVTKPTLSPPYTPILPHPDTPVLPPPVTKPNLAPPLKPEVKPPQILPPPMTKQDLSPPIMPEVKPPSILPPPLMPHMKPPTTSTPPLPYTPHVKPPSPELTSAAVQGFIFCKSDYNDAFPIEGATANAECQGVDGDDDQVFTSQPADANGNFEIPLGELSAEALNRCKVKLADSPLDTCNQPTNVNNGVAGVSLSSIGNPIVSPDKCLTTYPVGTFYYTGAHAPKPVY